MMRARMAVVGLCLAVFAAACSGGSNLTREELRIDPGDGLRVQTTDDAGNIEYRLCTLGAILESDTEPRRYLGVTAGHCGRRGDEVRTAEKVVLGVIATTDFGKPVVDKNARQFAPDRAVIEFKDLIRPRPRTVVITRTGNAEVGDRVCSIGIESGRTCGMVLSASPANILTTVRTKEGDSGAPLIRTSDEALIGTLTASVRYRTHNGDSATGSFFNQVAPILAQTKSHPAS